MAGGAQGHAADGAQPRCFAFVFPMASGHINPSLAVARGLVELGHEVHYLCREQMREAIEDTGAVFHADTEHEPELYEGREPDLFGAMEALKKELGLEGESMMQAMTKLKYLQLEMMLPGVVRWLHYLSADAVAYCPMANLEAACAAQALGIPSVALLTTAGPGSIYHAWNQLLAMSQITEEDVRCIFRSYEPHLMAVHRINSTYGLSIGDTPDMAPFGRLDVLKGSFATVVTTCEDLQDHMIPEVEQAYLEDGVRFEAVGPLLDKEGARRAGGHKLRSDDAKQEGTPAAGAKAASPANVHGSIDDADILVRVRSAHSVGRPVVLVSMGTVITGDSLEVGWEGRMRGPDGQKRGLTGRELCQAAWGGAFDAFGETSADEGPLLVVALGPQANALGGVMPPANAICVPGVPQVDVLKAGVGLFLTHGGQNSFTEALASGVPVVVCPGFGDQPVNAGKAEALGVGLQVPRPDPSAGAEAPAAAQYRADVAQALRRVLSEGSFRGRAAECGERLRRAGGVPRAVELMLAAATSRRHGRACTAPRQAPPSPWSAAQLAGA